MTKGDIDGQTMQHVANSQDLKKNSENEIQALSDLTSQLKQQLEVKQGTQDRDTQIKLL